MGPTDAVSGVIWLGMILLAGFVLYRLKTRRRSIGSAGAGAVYEHAGDPPSQEATARQALKEKGRDR